MISIIICSRKPDIPQELKENIKEIIGVDFELLVIDNSQNQYSIFRAYNEQAKRSKYPYLCFMHEDILFHTQDWGQKVVNYFEKDEKVGLLGVVGGHYAPRYPVPWWRSGLLSGQCLQGHYETTRNKQYFTTLDRYFDFIQDKPQIEVASVDGLWFCIKKELFYNENRLCCIEFDEKTYPGFHCYDIDICFQVWNIGLKVIVVSDVLIEHKSHGHGDVQWRKNLLKFYFKWQDKLPLIAGIHLTPEEIKATDEKISEYICSDIDNVFRIQEQLRNSKAYRLGSFMLKPLRLMKLLKSQINKNGK